MMCTIFARLIKCVNEDSKRAQKAFRKLRIPAKLDDEISSRRQRYTFTSRRLFVVESSIRNTELDSSFVYTIV